MPKKRTFKLVVSPSKTPAVKAQHGARYEVVAVKLHNPTGAKARPIAARLCGGTSTCLALMDVDPDR